jgi:hypothetical protein
VRNYVTWNFCCSIVGDREIFDVQKRIDASRHAARPWMPVKPHFNEYPSLSKRTKKNSQFRTPVPNSLHAWRMKNSEFCSAGTIHAGQRDTRYAKISK